MLGSTSSTASKKSSPKSGAAGSAGGSFCFYDVDLSSYESLGRFIGQLRTSRLLETIDGIFVAVGYQPTQPELVTFGACRPSRARARACAPDVLSTQASLCSRRRT